VREIATGIAILATHDATPWVWGRVAGDALDIATVALASPDRRTGEQRKSWTMAVLLCVTALDLYCATCLGSEKGGRRTARADYRDRSGFPGGAQAARGAALNFPVPRDFRGPEALRPQATEGARHPAGPTGEWVTSRSGA
jgi:hypothetical protein